MQLVQQVVGKIYVRKNQRRKKMVIVLFVQSLLLRELKISEATLTFQEGGHYHIEISPSVCRANPWTDFYMITASVLKGLRIPPL